MKKIKLTQGKYALVDDADFERLNQLKWYFTYYGYAARTTGSQIKKTKRVVQMYSLIVNIPKGLEVDHINGNKIDNRRSNLRLCTHAQNNMNKGSYKNNTSGYKGVSRWKNTGKWIAEIQANKKRLKLGLFSTAKLAYAAYCSSAKRYHGEFVRLK